MGFNLRPWLLQGAHLCLTALKHSQQMQLRYKIFVLWVYGSKKEPDVNKKWEQQECSQQKFGKLDTPLIYT